MRILKAGLIALASLAAVGALAGTLSAQGNNNGNPTILETIQALQGTTNALVATINALVTTVNGISESTTTGQVLFTPALVALPPDTYSCQVTNVSDDTLSGVLIQIIDAHTATGLGVGADVNIPPGIVTTAFAAPAVLTDAFCKIRVLGATKNAVRASMSIGVVGNSDKVVIAAQ